jgi:protein FAM32A
MSSYDFAGGGLKLKGVTDKIKKKKKSKKDKKTQASNLEHILPQRKRSHSPIHQENNDSQESMKSESSIKFNDQVIEKKLNEATIIVKKPAKTKAEIAFEKAVEKRLEKKILTKAEISHKERVEIYNKNLDQLSEYNDIPKVSWTK